MNSNALSKDVNMFSHDGRSEANSDWDEKGVSDCFMSCCD